MSSQIKRFQPKLQSSIPKKQEPDPSGWAVIAIVLIIIVIFFSWVIVSILNDSNATTVQNTCAPGLCAFNIFTGIKRCPATGDLTPLKITLGPERCSSANYCQSNGYNCAVKADQTLDCSGSCGTGNDKCRCAPNPTNTEIVI